MKRSLASAAISVSLVSATLAAQTPTPGRLDPRVTTVTYQPNNVVKVFATYGISTMIIFDEDEQFETLSLGDTDSWQVVPSEKGNVLFREAGRKERRYQHEHRDDQAYLLSRASRFRARGRQEGIRDPLPLSGEEPQR